jgi:hypothetical protein
VGGDGERALPELHHQMAGRAARHPSAATAPALRPHARHPAAGGARLPPAARLPAGRLSRPVRTPRGSFARGRISRGSPHGRDGSAARALRSGDYSQSVGYTAIISRHRHAPPPPAPFALPASHTILVRLALLCGCLARRRLGASPRRPGVWAAAASLSDKLSLLRPALMPLSLAMAAIRTGARAKVLRHTLPLIRHSGGCLQFKLAEMHQVEPPSQMS